MNTTPTGPRTRPLLIAATIPSVLSLAWTAWSVADMIPAPLPVALAAGIALDVALVAAVAIAWVAPAIARPAQIASWVIAAVAAAAIALHSWSISPALALMAAVPLISKALWHLALSAKAAGDAAEAAAAARAAEQAAAERAEADRKAARLSTALTEEEEAELAGLERQAAYVAAKADKQVALADARAQAEQRLRLAEIERDAQTQMATDEATAQIYVRRAELAHRIRLAEPVYTATEIGPRVPDDPSGLEGLPPASGTPVAGFGFPQHGARPARGASPADLRVPPGAPSGASPAAPGGAPRVEEALSGPQRLLAYVADAGGQATVKGAAREMGVHPRTIRRYRERLVEAGHDVSALGTDPADS
ncbi:hypothetical protein SAMN05421803_14315 [Nocardiopsis flavescens]|uniref:Homeodomain-like domain-containing protein n=1 Tax=Nocardiopsis flavescens TaxID=758803 RepID=A0A1M6WFB8_9ACTN|nr:hypothetical protein [Nocardiopsis flavescens]SHK92472.1 hypothetical protein SAMN05421803_14315 [Nocardiopsis flavescens]